MLHEIMNVMHMYVWLDASCKPVQGLINKSLANRLTKLSQIFFPPDTTVNILFERPQSIFCC